MYELHFSFDNAHKSSVFTLDQLLKIQCTAVYNGPVFMPYFLYSLNPVHCDHPSLAAMYSLSKLLPFIYQKERLQCKSLQVTAVASRRRTEELASVKCYQILSIFIFFIRLIILEDFIRLISYNGPCVRLGCSFFLATALKVFLHPTPQTGVCGEG